MAPEPNDTPVGDGQSTPSTDYKEEREFKKLPPAKQWRIMAEKGDVRAIMKEIEGQGPDVGVFASHLAIHLQNAIYVLACTDPAAFAEFLHTDLLTATGLLLVRAQFAFEHLFRQQIEAKIRRGDQPASQEFDRAAAKMLTLQMHVAKIQQIDATTQCAREQARKLKLANDKATAKKARKRQPGRRQRLSSPRQQQPMTPASRIGGDLP